jgi:hypothetical protein
MPTSEPPSRPPSRPLIREPRLAPVVGSDAHLPAVAPERLAPEAVRARFAPTLGALARTGADGADGGGDDAPWAPEFSGDGQAWPAARCAPPRCWCRWCGARRG